LGYLILAKPKIMSEQEEREQTDLVEAEVDRAEEEDTSALDRHECRSCGYVYEPTKGDEKRDVPPGTPFDDLPVNWRCPVCNAKKVAFVNIGPGSLASGFKENLGFGLGVNSLTPTQKNLLIFGALGLGFLFFISLYGLQ
jgi:rubredoxin